MSEWTELPYSALGRVPVVALEADLPADPVTGTIIYVTGTAELNLWDGSSWKVAAFT